MRDDGPGVEAADRPPRGAGPEGVQGRRVSGPQPLGAGAGAGRAMPACAGPGGRGMGDCVSDQSLGDTRGSGRAVVQWAVRPHAKRAEVGVLEPSFDRECGRWALPFWRVSLVSQRFTVICLSVLVFLDLQFRAVVGGRGSCAVWRLPKAVAGGLEAKVRRLVGRWGGQTAAFPPEAGVLHLLLPQGVWLLCTCLVGDARE